MRKDLNLEEIGKVAALVEDGSPLQLGATGRYIGRPFEVIGRIQLQFSAGFWNEWHVDYAGKSAWVGETSGIYVFTELLKEGFRKNIPAFKEMTVGLPVEITNSLYFATDIQKGKCVSAEGELPFSFNSGYDAPVVDLVDSDERFATLDYSEGAPLIFLGDFAEFNDLSLKNLRDLYGWKKPA